MSAQAAPDPAAAADVYWRSHCDGFSVHAAGRRLGVVEQITCDAGGEIVALRVLGGLFGNRRLEIPAALIDRIVPAQSLVVLKRLPAAEAARRRWRRSNRSAPREFSLTIDVEDSPEIARDLADALSRRGLPSSRGRKDGSTVTIRTHEHPRTLLPDLAAALALWLEDRGRSGVAVQTGERRFRVRLAERSPGGGS
jgi:hypothetical protein